MIIPKRTLLFVMSVAIVFQGCGTTSAPPVAAAPGSGNDLMNAVVWIQTSAEADALRRQTFVVAREALDRALADPEWTAADEQTGSFGQLPPAVIVDVDETVLDNAALEARLIRGDKAFTYAVWTDWVEERSATALPGAVEFARYAEAHGVTMFYVTNRKAEEEAATRDNLVRVGFPVEDAFDVVLTQGENGAPSDKSSRRAAVAATHRVLLMLGDDLGDFTSKEGSVADRLASVKKHESRWGQSWFVLPNPMYGSWERALAAGPAGDGSHARKLDALDEALD